MKYQENDWVYDIEFYQNFFCVNFLSFPEPDNRRVFEISPRRDDRKELLEFLKQDGLRTIGFNNVGYDYPVLHILIENPDISLWDWWTRIQQELFTEGKRHMIWDSERHVYQIDIYKINHYDNPAKSVSLKYLEFTQRWHKVQDLPIDPKSEVPLDQMDKMIAYCWNDVEFTHEFCLENINAIRFRENMSEKLGRNLMDYSDVKIGEYLNQLKYLELTGKKWKDIKNERTFRKQFPMKYIIPEVVEFQTPLMKKWLETIRNITFYDKEEQELVYDIVISPRKGIQKVVEGGIPVVKKQLDIEQKKLNCIVRFAKGGLHSVDMPRVFAKKEGWKLMEKDVGSMYPRAIVVDKIYPYHLGVEWNDGISAAYNYRIDELKPKLKALKKYSNEWNDVNDEQAVYKLAMNGGGFGKLGSMHSWQYDPLAKYRVTIGCELKLLMLIESFVINDIEIVSVNTDGVVIHYPEEKQEIVDKLHIEWEQKTGMILEDTHYNKIVFSSVNDYIAQIINPDTGEVLYNKYKGDFEIDKDPHKNNSQRIVPITLSEYFMKGKKLNEIIGKLGYEFENSRGEKEQVTIYDYCLAKKSTRSSHYLQITKGKAEKIPDKVIRYYIARTQSSLLKHYTRGKMKNKYEKVNLGWNVQMFMDYLPPASISAGRDGNGNYLIDTRYYINECLKVIKSIERGTRYLEQGVVEQTELF